MMRLFRLLFLSFVAGVAAAGFREKRRRRCCSRRGRVYVVQYTRVLYDIPRVGERASGRGRKDGRTDESGDGSESPECTKH